MLFYLAGLRIESYPVFVLLALLTGILLYRWQLRQDRIQGSNALYIAIFAISGGIIGAKLPIIIMYWQELNAAPHSLSVILSGRTIVGGLIGGTLGTWGAKRLFGIKERLGNQIAIPLAVSMAVGRIGCLLRGCCYGEATTLPWGIDFGDHILRHPTQIYEMIFDGLLVLFLIWKKQPGVRPGELFTILINSYLSFRFWLEFIRVEKVFWLGLTGFQWLCVASLLYINRQFIIQIVKRRRVKEHERCKET